MAPRKLSVLTLLAAFSSWPGAGWAQTRSSITGTVRDTTGGVLQGVTLVVESPGLVGGPLSATSSGEGTYRFTELSPGRYAITASAQGFRTVKRTDLIVQFASTLTIDLTFSPGALTEVVTVDSASPVVDVTTARAAGRLDQELLKALPVNPNLRGFSAFEVFTLTPGVTTNRTAHGGSRDANNLMIDGVASTIPNRAGVNAATLAYNWIEEVQVVSLGANAEYGDFTGTISNVVIRSGGNVFHGLLDYETTRHGWTGNNTRALTPAQQTQFKPLNITNQTDVSAQLGGRLLQNRLFFFGGLSYYYQKQVPSGSLGDTPRVDKLPRYVGKLNWAASPRVKVEALLEHDNLGVDNPKAGPTVAPEANYSSSSNKYLWSSRLTWTATNSTLVELRLGGMHIFEDVTPRAPGTWDGPPGHLDRTTGVQSVNVASLLGTDEGTRTTFGGSVSRFASHFWGKSHSLKLGAEAERLKYNETSRYPGGILYQDLGGKPDQAILFGGSRIAGTGWRTSLFLQDTWGVTERITLEPGLRVARNRGSVPVKGKVFSTNPVSPRLGIAWDVTGDHKTVIRGHYGRFHEALFTSLYQFLDTSQQPATITARVLANGSFQEITRVTPATNFGIDPDVSQAYVEQYLAGVERELFRDVSVSAQYIGRRYKNMFAFVDTKSSWGPVTMRDPGPDGVANNADDGSTLTTYNLLNPNQAFLMLTNPGEAYRNYDALEIGARKRFSHHWQANAAYTYSKTAGNVSNGQGTNVGLGEAGQTGNFVDPNHLTNMDGRAIFDAPHQVLIQATYSIPRLGGINVSPRYRYQSGTPWGRTAVFRGFAQGTETVRIEPRGTRRNPAASTVDLRLEKLFSVGPRDRKLSAYVDLANLTNQGAGTFREPSGATFGTLASWSSPRLVQAGARLTF